MNSDEIVESLDAANRSLQAISNAITPAGASPAHTSDGGTVSSLTEAMIFVGNGLMSIAEAVGDHAEAIGDLAEAIGDLAEAVRARDQT